jgi:hypothetical protein
VTEQAVDVLVVGGGLGGVAAALGAARRGRRVMVTEETDWLGGQLTQQAVPPDEHPWIEQFGATASYRDLRETIRGVYRRARPLAERARSDRRLNPGGGRVSALCCEPRVAVAALHLMLAPHRGASGIDVRHGYRPVAASVNGDRVEAVTLAGPHGELTVTADIVLDATETGDLLPLAGAEHVTGFESRAETGEPHAPDRAQPHNLQAVTHCFAVEHLAGEDHTIDRPTRYGYWSTARPASWSGPQLSWTAPDPKTGAATTHRFEPNPVDDPLAVGVDLREEGGAAELWRFRRIRARTLFVSGAYRSDITLVNWPMVDYVEGSVYGPDAEDHRRGARELSRSFLYWLQTEAPRPDGGTGYPGLRLRGDVLGTDDGFAKRAYVRESRRIRARRTVTELDVGVAATGLTGPARVPDTVGVGCYRIDLHPSTGGDGYLDVAARPFEIPLGALLPVRLTNLLPAAKNLGTTHITNGCYRLHPTEWNIGEVAGLLAAHCLAERRSPHQVWENVGERERFQALLASQGVELHWPEIAAY